MRVYDVWPVWPGPWTWARGDARFEDGWIILEHPVVYVGEDDPNRVFALAGVRDPDGAIAFARVWGLLSHSGEDGQPVREAFADWQGEAALLTRVIELYVALMNAIAGDALAMVELRERWEPKFREHTALVDAELSDTNLLRAMSLGVAHLIEEGRGNTRSGFVAAVDFFGDEGDPGVFGFTSQPPTLLAHLYNSLGQLVMHRDTVRFCPECHRSFRATDTRQRYCTPLCSNRVRMKRFQAKRGKAESTSDIDAGSLAG